LGFEEVQVETVAPENPARRKYSREFARLVQPAIPVK
jgi:hypothetical protein